MTKVAKKMQEAIDKEMMESWRYKTNFFKIHDRSIVDDATWYTVSCYDDTSQWLRSQDRELWHEHIEKRWAGYHNIFDVHEKLYTMLALKFS